MPLDSANEVHIMRLLGGVDVQYWMYIMNIADSRYPVILPVMLISRRRNSSVITEVHHTDCEPFLSRYNLVVTRLARQGIAAGRHAYVYTSFWRFCALEDGKHLLDLQGKAKKSARILWNIRCNKRIRLTFIKLNHTCTILVWSPCPNSVPPWVTRTVPSVYTCTRAAPLSRNRKHKNMIWINLDMW